MTIDPGTSRKRRERKRRCVVLKSFHIAESYTNSKFAIGFKKNFFEKKPFPHHLFKNFLNNSSGIIEELETKLQEFPNWKRKENDLYSLYQTDDFKSFSPLLHPELYSFRQFLCDEVKTFLQNITELELTEVVDVNGSCYSEFDTLLPHNDLIETRKFAFVYYLSPFVWKKEYGGQLILFNSNHEEQPVSEAIEIDPARNSLMVFEVSQKSWHAVKEIMADSYPRLSINGWFHSTTTSHPLPQRMKSLIPRHHHQQQQQQHPTVLSLQNPIDKSKVKFESLLNDWWYNNEEGIVNIQEKFADTSEGCISQFLKKEHNDRFLNILKTADFKTIGPLNKRKILEITPKSLQQQNSLSQLLETFRTSSALKFLSRLTGCIMNECKVSCSVYKIEKGSYTVLGDEDLQQQFQNNNFALETYLFIGEGEWSQGFGGQISYVGIGDEEELVSFYPQCNSFMMVLRDTGAASFLKYINSSCDVKVYMICIRYHNVTTEDN